MCGGVLGREPLRSQQLSFAGSLLIPSWPHALQVRQVSPLVSIRGRGGCLRSHRASFSHPDIQKEGPRGKSGRGREVGEGVENDSCGSRLGRRE